MYDPKRGYPVVVPYVLYRDPAAAARWLVEVLSSRETIRFTMPDGGPVGHGKLECDGAVLLLGLTGGRFGDTSSITLVFVDEGPSWLSADDDTRTGSGGMSHRCGQ